MTTEEAVAAAKADHARTDRDVRRALIGTVVAFVAFLVLSFWAIAGWLT